MRAKLMVTVTILLIFFSFELYSQDSMNVSCRIVKQYSDGSMLIEINGKKMLAITENMEKNMLKMRRDLLDAQKEIVLKDSLLANYDVTITQYEKSIANMKAYISELESIMKGYKQLANEYKRINEPWVNVNFGMGATSDDKKPALLMGIDVRRILLTGFIQERNSGVFIGTRFRIF